MDKKHNDNVVIISHKIYSDLEKKYENLELSYTLLEQDYDTILQLCLDFQHRLLENNLLTEQVIEVNETYYDNNNNNDITDVIMLAKDDE